MLDELKPYLEMANGLTEMTRQRATEAAKALIAQGVLLSAKGGASEKDVREVADEVLGAVQANRDLLLDMVRGEVAKATGAMGFVHVDELDAARRHIERLERQVTALKAQVAELARGEGAAPAEQQSGQGRMSDPDARVAAALARLDEMDALPVADHADIYADVHERLSGALSDVHAD